MKLVNIDLFSIPEPPYNSNRFVRLTPRSMHEGRKSRLRPPLRPNQHFLTIKAKSMTKQFIAACGISAVLAMAAFSANPAGTRGLTPEDYYAIETAGDPHISPNGQLVAYTVTSIDRKQNRKVSRIWMAAIDGGRAPWAFTGGESSASPRWNPDGRALAFLSARHDPRTGAAQRSQVYLLSMSGGEGRRITDLKNGVTAFQWSPDGKRIACVSTIGPSDGLPPGKERSDVRDYTNPGYKFDGKGFFDDRRDHIWIVDVSTGASTQITSGGQGNDSEPQWSPDGTRIAYLTERMDMSMRQAGEIHVIPADGGTPIRIAAPGTGLHALRWSHDGRSLAYIGCIDEIAIPKIWVSPVTGGNYRLASDAVTYPTAIEWTADGSGLYFTAASRGEFPLSRLDIATGKASALTAGIAVRGMDVYEATRRIVYDAGDYRHPADIFVADESGTTVAQLTHLNQDLLSELALQPFERLPYTSADGWKIEGFFVKPVGWQAGKAYPMILMIHGGPNGMFGIQWNHEAQAYAARGWAVLMTNPRGSSGYGEPFQRGVEKEWGGKAFQDIMAGVDAALAKYQWIDPNRLGVTGQSFGGFMTDWIVGQTTRFKGAVTLSGISDLISVEGTRDAFYGHDRDFGGDLWTNFDLYWKYSPIRNAPRIKTPTLILHGDSDHRVPVSQGEEFFRALCHFGVPAEMVMFPREPHSLRSEPKHAVEVLQWQIYWFDRYVAGNPGAVKPNQE